MSSEERFVKIENALSTLAEHHVHHAEEIRELRAMQKDVVVSQRDVALSQKGMVLAITKVAEAQRGTDELQQVTERKLQALIDTVDRIVRDRGRS